MYRVTGCLLYIQFPFTEKDSQFILTVIFIFISKLNHIISKLEMTALSLSPSPSLSVVAEGPQDSLDCCITSWVSKLIEGEGITFCLDLQNGQSKK